MPIAYALRLPRCLESLACGFRLVTNSRSITSCVPSSRPTEIVRPWGDCDKNARWTSYFCPPWVLSRSTMSA